MGRKFTVPYALYRCHGFISAALAEQTGFSEEDLKLFWEALLNMFEHDRSAARGEMNTRKLVVFEHDSKLGNFPAHKLFERVKVSRANDPAKPARSFEDYVVTIDKNPINGVRVDEKL
jgi:CRISPR-associated protein Csd2